MAEHDTTDFTDPVQRDAFGHWLSGFVDGEGSFNVETSGMRKGIATSGYCCRFTIQLRFDDRPILEEIARFLGCGQLYNRKQRGTSKPAAVLFVRRINDIIERLIPHFNRYPLRAKKSRDFEIFREAAILWADVAKRKHLSAGYNKGSHPKWRPEERERFEHLAFRMKSVRAFSHAEQALIEPPRMRKNLQRPLFSGDA